MNHTSTTLLTSLALLLVSTLFLSGCTGELSNTNNTKKPTTYQTDPTNNIKQNQALSITPPEDISSLTRDALAQIDLGIPVVYNAKEPYKVSNDAPKQGFILGTTTVTWTVTDADNNSTTASQLVTISEPLPLSVERLSDLDFETNNELIVPNLSLPIVSGGIAPFSITHDLPTEGISEGSYIINWTITDSTGEKILITQHIDIVSMCDANINYFSQHVWPVLKTNCIMCHSDNGSQTPFNLVEDIDVDHLKKNIDMFSSISKKTDINGLSLFLVKPINSNNDHGGGTVLQNTSTEFSKIKTMVDRIKACVPPEPVITVDPLVLLDFEATLRKASIQLIGRVPTVAENNRLAQAAQSTTPNNQETVFLEIINTMLSEDAFIKNIKTIFNDKLLTNAYNTGTRGLGLRLNTFDNNKYFDNTTLETEGYVKVDRNTIRRNASTGIATAPLELIAHVVKNDLPFTEILTADYVMVNPYSARVFSAAVENEPNFSFSYGDTATEKDPTLFLPARLTDNKNRLIPHAGVLSTLPFLARFPSTATNVNRKRAATIFKLFLDINIEGLASRASLDLDNVIGDFPTLQDPQCKVCHDVMDPVAGLFKNWGNNGDYRGDYTQWGDTKTPPQMLAPGYSIAEVDTLPSNSSDKALAWLAQRIAADNGFAVSMSKMMFEAVSGQTGLVDSVLFESLKNTFIQSNYDIKALIKEIVLTEQFRADTAINPANIINVNDLGTAHLLTPEQLSAKITSLTGGYIWKSPSNKLLTDTNTYNILYGGIDSENIINRTTKTTGIMAAVQQRIAFQTSCETTALDFSKPNAERVYFKFVEYTDVPTDTASELKIKKNIQYLAKYLLGETIDSESPELTETYNLFLSAIANSDTNSIPSKCRAGLSSSNPIIVDDNKTVRAWMAVLSYLYLDYKFLYQ